MKPVAWMSQGGDVSRNKDYFEEMGFKDLIPLYTAPRELSDELFNAKLEILRLQDDVHWLTNHPLKELIDEEIHNLFLSYCDTGFMRIDDIGFAKAILKKASEK